MANVRHVRQDVSDNTPRWIKVDDCLKGQDAIKAKGTQYLPKPNAEDTSEANSKRYEAYKERAVFYSVTKRTLDGLTGQVFSRDSVIDLPANFDALVADAQGDGVPLEQQAKRTLDYILAYGRAGLLADYPKTEGSVTKADVETGNVRPTVKLYSPFDVINWATETVGATVRLKLLVLVEYEDVSTDDFEYKSERRYRVLRLRDGVYTVQMYRDVDSTSGAGTAQEPVGDEITPKGADGQPLREIPFVFVGSVNNDWRIDDAPLYDLAELNIAHYRNSADYEESSFVVGQPTVWVSGISEEWAKEVMGGKITVGSRGVLPLPRDGQAGILQPAPNTLPFEAMQHKERQMVAIGAKLVQESAVQRTATEAKAEESAELSVLATATKNVTTAYRAALKFAALFTGDVLPDDETTWFALNDDFDLSTMTPQERQQLIAEWQAEAISYTEMRTNLKRAGIATQADEQAQAEIDENPPITAIVDRTLNANENQDNQDNEDNNDDE